MGRLLSLSGAKKAKGEKVKLRQKASELAQTEIAFIPSREFASMSLKDPGLLVRSASSEANAQAECAGAQPVVQTQFEPLLCLGSALNEPLLSAAEERDEFRRMNFLKFAANRLRARLNPDRPSKRLVEEIQRLLSLAGEARERILRANLRLVVSNASSYSSPAYSFEELFSDGVVSLIEGAEKFDYSRGYRFSTYATHCIRRGFYRRIDRCLKQRRRFLPTDPEILCAARDDEPVDELGMVAGDTFLRQLFDRIDDCLSERERQIVEGRYGLGNRPRPLTLVELSDELGICKERVRQLEHKAIEKLRVFAKTIVERSPSLMEALSA